MTQHKENYSWVYIGVAVLIGGAILYFLFFSSNSGYVKIKYRDDKVNISASNFEPLDKSDSTVKSAWYDSSNEYMVINLSGTYYHYCGMPSSAWGGFKTASSPYQYYQDSIKGNFDCRENPIPRYE
jgi:KTSC domain